ncbi:unnamed protein product [Schistosoma turkestanicum]|nr:unnamed protein product [Schistosoma turkestanicum]
MDDTDPYFCMQDEVCKNLQLTKTLYEDWKSGSASDGQKLLTKIRQTVKNIEWDLMDLQETIAAVENNPTKFHLSDKDISARRQFLIEAKNVVKNVKNHLNKSDNNNSNNNNGINKRNDSSIIDFTVHTAPHPSSAPAPPPASVLCNGDLKVNNPIPITNKVSSSSSPNMMKTTINTHQKTASSLLPSSDIYSTKPFHHPLTQQKQLLSDQDNQLDQLSTTISNLKGMSQRIGDELSDQVMLLDDFNSEMISTESRLDSITKRTARLLHLNTDRRQWCAIFSLLVTFIVILILFAIL